MDKVKHVDASDRNEVEEKGGQSKIALVPFVEADPPVHLADATGRTFPARGRSAEDDFRLAVQSLGVNQAEDSEGGDKGDGPSSPKDGAGGGGHDRPQPGDGEGTAGCENSLPTGGGGPAASKVKPAVAPAEHPLQKAVTSFDMALGELNQLVHLIDLARAGEFMALERVTPSEEDQAKAIQDKAAKPGDGVPREALATMVNLKRNHLKGAADQLRQRAKRLRETTKAQRVFQQGVIHLRKTWRIVAPNHGKVNVPLQVGEPLCVDCSFGSAGGRSVPVTAAAGTRHRHPWFFQLTCGEGGRLEAEPQKGQCLKALEVQLVSATSGACEHSLRTSFPSRHDCQDKAGGVVEEVHRKSNGKVLPEREATGDTVQLEQCIARLQHSVFWEEVFETIKAEALSDGKDGWPVRQDTRCGKDAVGADKAPRDCEARIQQAEGKRRLVSVSSQGTTSVARDGGTRVVHVMDDEVMVEMDDQYLVGYRLVSGEGGSVEEVSSPTSAADADGDDLAAESCGESWDKGPGLAALCELALLYGASLIRQNQLDQVETVGSLGSPHSENAREARAVPTTADGGAGTGTSGRPSTSVGCTWQSIGSVLLHHSFRTEVVRELASVSRSLLQIGLPFTVRWTHLETTCASSALSFTVGHCFHFRASLDDGCGVVVSALAGLHNHADQRSVELQSADALRQFLLGEVCRQIVLTFGDIATEWTSGTRRYANCFRVDLVPAAIHLLPTPGAQSPDKKSVSSGESSGSGWEVRVCVQEAGVQIACSKWPSACCTPTEVKAGKAKMKAEPEGWDCGVPNTVSAPEVTVAEWDRLEGRDLFLKFSGLLACLYPLRD